MNKYTINNEKTYIVHADSKTDFNLEDSNEETVLHTDDNSSDSYEPPKKIEVVTDNGKNLNISDVSEYIEVEKPKDEKKENIIIPQEK